MASWFGRGSGAVRAVGLAVVAALMVAACSSDEARIRPIPEGAGPHDAAAIVEVVEGLSAGSPAGFDPAAWTDATDQAAVLAEGATVTVVEDSWSIQGDSATVDAIVTTPGAPDARHWVFLRRSDGGEWVVYSTLPLEPES